MTSSGIVIEKENWSMMSALRPLIAGIVDAMGAEEGRVRDRLFFALR